MLIFLQNRQAMWGRFWCAKNIEIRRKSSGEGQALVYDNLRNPRKSLGDGVGFGVYKILKFLEIPRG